jgi:CheY-like chemotaxis protein
LATTCDLAIIDYDMPGMDGIRTFEALRLLIPNLRAVLYTGNPDLVQLQRRCPDGLVCEAKDFKPQRVQALMKHLEKRG